MRKRPGNLLVTMAAVKRFDHVLIVIEDLEAATAFFVKLGFEIEGKSTLEGDWVDALLGLQDIRSDIVLLRLPNGETKVELSKFHSPVPVRGPQDAPTNQLGLRNVTFEVDDLQTTVDWMRADGYEPVGEIVEYEDFYRLCYVRGPEGIIIFLVEPIS
jgi:catechol 2,3-dioxygenase-like lactoylglutathione lyase family enzyme